MAARGYMYVGAPGGGREDDRDGRKGFREAEMENLRLWGQFVFWLLAIMALGALALKPGAPPPETFTIEDTSSVVTNGPADADYGHDPDVPTLYIHSDLDPQDSGLGRWISAHRNEAGEVVVELGDDMGGSVSMPSTEWTNGWIHEPGTVYTAKIEGGLSTLYADGRLVMCAPWRDAL